MSEFDYIRKKTRLALPVDDEYLFRVGVALYGFNSINNFLIEIIAHLDATADRTLLGDHESGLVLRKFRTVTNLWVGESIEPHASLAASLFEILNSERTDFVHAYPITSPSGAQVLHRRRDSKGKYFEVSVEFLDSFIERLDLVSDELYKIRSIVKPNI
jgi:hypothetical protein